MTLTLGPVQRQRNEVILPLITCMASPGIKLFFEPTLLRLTKLFFLVLFLAEKLRSYMRLSSLSSTFDYAARTQCHPKALRERRFEHEWVE